MGKGNSWYSGFIKINVSIFESKIALSYGCGDNQMVKLSEIMYIVFIKYFYDRIP
jgi:hypothetical protein